MFMVYFHHDKSNQIIYIGKSRNEHTRPEAHKYKEWGTESKYITYIECENEVDMDLYEIYYINVYKPKYNVAKKYKSYPTIQLAELEFKSYDKLKMNFKKSINERKNIITAENKNTKKSHKGSRAFRKAEEERRHKEFTEQRNKTQKISYHIGEKPELLLGMMTPTTESFTLDGKTEFGIRNSLFQSLPEDSVNLFRYLFKNGNSHDKDEYGYVQIDLLYNDYLMAMGWEDTKESEQRIKKSLDELPKMHFYEFSMNLPILKVITIQGKLFISGLLPVQRCNGVTTKRICIMFYHDFLNKYFDIPKLISI
jgi:hypothetical protein